MTEKVIIVGSYDREFGETVAVCRTLATAIEQVVNVCGLDNNDDEDNSENIQKAKDFLKEHVTMAALEENGLMCFQICAFFGLDFEMSVEEYEPQPESQLRFELKELLN